MVQNSFANINLTSTFLRKVLTSNKNLLLIGKHGVSKSTQIMDVLNKDCPEKWVYFSASTLDPWTDLIGVPKPGIDSNGRETLNFIRPARLNESLEVIVIDEINRAPKKVLNAILELIQFKTLNGMEFPNLRCVWACANPSDDRSQNYTVDQLDDALMDRFHVIVNVSHVPSEEYLMAKYGKEIARNAMTWYVNLPEGVYISPRRLDYAIDAYVNHSIQMVFTLPMESNPQNLQKKLVLKSFQTALDDGEDISSMLRNHNVAGEFMEFFLNAPKEKKAKYIGFVRFVPNEIMMAMLSDQDNIIRALFERPTQELSDESTWSYSDWAPIYSHLDEDGMKTVRLIVEFKTTQSPESKRIMEKVFRNKNER